MKKVLSIADLVLSVLAMVLCFISGGIILSGTILKPLAVVFSTAMLFLCGILIILSLFLSEYKPAFISLLANALAIIFTLITFAVSI